MNRTQYIGTDVHQETISIIFRNVRRRVCGNSGCRIMFFGIRSWAEIRVATIQQLGRSVEKVLEPSVLRGHDGVTKCALRLHQLLSYRVEVRGPRESVIGHHRGAIVVQNQALGSF